MLLKQSVKHYKNTHQSHLSDWQTIHFVIQSYKLLSIKSAVFTLRKTEMRIWRWTFTPSLKFVFGYSSSRNGGCAYIIPESDIKILTSQANLSI